ncbi:MAG TPA: hypothetical protein VE173_10230, partial [Longimicrobiales bacterium]|nr:hypothetical protein [Longimicrobiales bacterium]
MSRLAQRPHGGARLVGLIALLALAGPLAAQTRPPLIVDDYAAWKRIGSVGLSPDGAWMSYAYTPLEGDDTLFVRELDGDGLFTMVRGSSPDFSRDSHWVAYMVSPPEREGRGRRGQAPPGGGRGRGGGDNG